MPSLLQSTLNTRPLPTGDRRFIRSDCPEKLTDEEVEWLLQNQVTTIVDLREKKEYERTPCRLETEDGFTFYHMPVTGGGDTPKSPEEVASVYLGMLISRWMRLFERLWVQKAMFCFFVEREKTGQVLYQQSY